MEFAREYYDKTDDKVVMEFNATEEEKNALMKKCEELNLTLDEYVEKMLTWFVENPKEAGKWIKEHREDKNPKGVIGYPKYKVDDLVGFYIKPYKSEDEEFFKGKVYIVDAYGTFEQNEEPSYDIMVDNFGTMGQTLVKHVRESNCYDIHD